MALKFVKTKLKNTDENQNTGNKKFDTEDYVYFPSYDDVKTLSNKARQASATDFAITQNCYTNASNQAPDGRDGTISWLRSAYSVSSIRYTFSSGELDYILACIAHLGGRPCVAIDLKSIISARSAQPAYTLEEVKNGGEDDYRVIKFPELMLPQTKVKDSLSKKLEDEFNKKKLKTTGKTILGRDLDDETAAREYEEYVYNNEFYVRADVTPHDNAEKYSDGSKVVKNENVWLKVEPIRWKILNWNELPKDINPKGKNKTDRIVLQSEQVLLSGLCMYPDWGNIEMTMWQNTKWRAFLNGYDLHKEIKSGNGNASYLASQNFDYTGRGFLNQIDHSALIKKTEKTEEKVESENVEPEKEKPNPYDFAFDDLENDDLLKLYVEANAAVFLHGPSGVGKSQRIKQLDPTATRITLRPNMNPEEVDGTLDRETGNYIPPIWYTQLCEKCKAEPNRKHVLFIDELTNVKPAIQSIIYSIVLDRAGKDGLWPLPENAVVVAAGNESADNLAAYPMTNALFRRFCHIYYDVDKEDWLDWATGISKVQPQTHKVQDNEPRARIHPAIVSYIMSRDDNILNQDLDEENPTIVTDPRKWEIASNVLYSTKNPKALVAAIGEDLTTDFVDFVQKINISVEDVMSGNYDINEFIEKDFAEQLSSILGLCMANEEELPKVRAFIDMALNKEILATFDSLWIRNDPERAAIIADCQMAYEEVKKDACK